MSGELSGFAALRRRIAARVGFVRRQAARPNAAAVGVGPRLVESTRPAAPVLGLRLRPFLIEVFRQKYQSLDEVTGPAGPAHSSHRHALNVPFGWSGRPLGDTSVTPAQLGAGNRLPGRAFGWRRWDSNLLVRAPSWESAIRSSPEVQLEPTFGHGEASQSSSLGR